MNKHSCDFGKIFPVSFGLAGGIVSALCLIVVVTLAHFGYHTGSLELIAKTHVFFAPTLAGIIAGALESFVHGFLFFAVLAWLYNCCPIRSKCCSHQCDKCEKKECNTCAKKDKENLPLK